ncbi:MAG: 50S ribosomal protein L3 N(5)-glutamine methyltransferase [Burkholderiales bacterium]|nr:50S ribosomal protein L3 N(5)-glutamine methyltransferase [Burkholderiales bacterium]
MYNFNECAAQAKNKLINVRDIIRFMVSSFQEHNLSYGHGTNNPYDEAVYLTLATLHLPIDQLEPYLDAKLLDYEIDNLLNVCKRRVEQRIPAPYITNEANFQGYKFYVDSRVIIPRSYIAEIILNGRLDEYIEHTELVHNVLDLCTGNGSISIIAADYFYDSNILASDVDQNALDVAKINIEKYSLQDKIKLLRSNLFEDIPMTSKFDLILTNPPYVDMDKMNSLPVEYTHEPSISLFGGSDGLGLIELIITQARHYLNEFGIIVLEMGDNKLELEEHFLGLDFKWLATENNQGFVFVLTKKDLDNFFA